MAHWGEVKYGDGTPVPLRASRCPRTLRSSGQHPCKLEVGHDKEHRCVCGEKWVDAKAPEGEKNA